MLTRASIERMKHQLRGDDGPRVMVAYHDAAGRLTSLCQCGSVPGEALRYLPVPTGATLADMTRPEDIITRVGGIDLLQVVGERRGIDLDEV